VKKVLDGGDVEVGQDDRQFGVQLKGGGLLERFFKIKILVIFELLMT
jgi:hypothetical protein